MPSQGHTQCRKGLRIVECPCDCLGVGLCGVWSLDVCVCVCVCVYVCVCERERERERERVTVYHELMHFYVRVGSQCDTQRTANCP